MIDSPKRGLEDLIDFGHLAGGFGNEGKWADGNFDGFLSVNIFDFGLLADNYGKTLTAPEANITPECETLLVLGLGGLMLLRRRRVKT